MHFFIKCCTRELPSQPPGSHFDSQTQDFWENDTQFNLVKFSVNVQSNGIFQKFYSYKTIGALNDIKKQTCLAMSRVQLFQGHMPLDFAVGP